MGYIFRINKGETGTKSTIVDWSNTTRSTYDYGFVNRIKDSTTTQSEITSIPSPFARIELVKEAFRKVAGESLNNLSISEIEKRLHGDSIYHKMVSDSLDVGQIFFNYPSMKDRVEIKVWNKKNIDELLNSSNTSHKTYGKSLKMFFEQDGKGSDPYNFGKMQNIYILKYIGPNQKPMHIIGATSPATLFFSTANDEAAISKYLCFGTDYAFDKKYSSLDQRDPEYLKYIFTLRFSISDFDKDFPEVSSYLDAVYYLLDNSLKDEINMIQNNCYNIVNGKKSFIDSNYEVLNVSVNTTVEQQVEINGFPIHYKTVNIKGNTDFEIQATKYIKLEKTPLVLPINTNSIYDNLEYYGCKFGRTFRIPYYDKNDLSLRQLPGININYPYLTISDFLDDKIIKLPSEFNSVDFFNGNLISKAGTKEGYLLPINKIFFDFFSAEDLMGKTPSGKNFIEIKELASGVEVILRIPIAKGDIEYKRIYTLDMKADKENNTGAIVLAPEDFMIGVFPPIKFKSDNDAHYRIAILSDFDINKECSCICHNENDSFFSPDYVIRNVDIEGDIRSKVYILEKKTFDSAFISILTNQPGKENRATGILVPKFKQRLGNSSLTFAIDLGTSNTHIEYTSGTNKMPESFAFDKDNPQFSMVCKPSDLIRMHVRGEFLPESINNNSQCHFPTRTVLCIDKNNAGINETKVGPYVAFGNASPAFMYNKADVGIKYNDYIPNLKWSTDPNNQEHIRCYIESIFLMIRTKVIQEGGNLNQTQIKWFYPISMSNYKRGLFDSVWTAAYKKYFNPKGKPISITESIAPYSFFQDTRPDVADIVTIDIGGGTTDIVVADANGVKLVTSMRFAADAIFGNILVPVQNGSLNGIIKQFKDEFIDKLDGLDDLQKMLIEKTANNKGNSLEVASFLFSLEENEQVKQKQLQEQLNFNSVLTNDNSQKIVFYIFFTSIMYHIANLMKAKGLSIPKNIAFSGNGSKVISILSPVTESLETLTTRIFTCIYDVDISTDIKLIINSDNPKEATCKGGLLLKQPSVNVNNVKDVLLGTKGNDLVDKQTYENIPIYYDNIVNEVRSFWDFIFLTIPNKIPLNNEFGIDQQSISLATDCFNRDLKTYIQKGVDMKLASTEISKNDIIEESLFFYPIIGIINDLSESIFKKQAGGHNHA